MILRAALLALGLSGLAGLAQDSATSAPGALLRGLDKVNGETVDVTVAAGGSAPVFGLRVELADCRYPSENPTGDAFAYLVIRDEGSDQIRFEGWMIASSPALNALDHSRYDVWVLRCTTS